MVQSLKAAVQLAAAIVSIFVGATVLATWMGIPFPFVTRAVFAETVDDIKGTLDRHTREIEELSKTLQEKLGDLGNEINSLSDAQLETQLSTTRDRIMDLQARLVEMNGVPSDDPLYRTLQRQLTIMRQREEKLVRQLED